MSELGLNVSDPRSCPNCAAELPSIVGLRVCQNCGRSVVITDMGDVRIATAADTEHLPPAIIEQLRRQRATLTRTH